MAGTTESSESHLLIRNDEPDDDYFAFPRGNVNLIYENIYTK